MALEKVLALDATGVIEKEIDTGGSGGPTADTICTLALTTLDIVNAYKPQYFQAGVGAAWLPQFDAAVDAMYPTALGNNTQGVQQAGSGGTFTKTTNQAADWTISTGTTATGYGYKNLRLMPLYASAANSPYSIIAPTTPIGTEIACSVNAYVSALSDATNSYVCSVALLGAGGSIADVVAGDSGINVCYTHSVNSGNYTIKYRGADSTLKTINTSIPPGVGAGNAKRITALLTRTGASSADITVNIAGTDFVITDSTFNIGNSYIFPAIGWRIQKTLGTTARTHNLRHMMIAHNFK